MTLSHFKKSGFTLIELLVVVLIIGILAAIALPQYQKAVERSRAAEIKLIMNAIYKAQQSHFLATGAFGDFTEIDIDIPNVTIGNYSGTTNTVIYNDKFKIMVDLRTAGGGISDSVWGSPLGRCDTTPGTFAAGTTHCYLLDLNLNTGAFRCIDGTLAPVKFTCKDVGF